MGFVDGVVLDSPAKAELLDRATRARASDDLVDTLADLHARRHRRHRARRPRQARRVHRAPAAPLATQWANSKTRELPAIDEVADRLAAPHPGAAGRRHRPRRLPLRQLPDRSRARPHQRRPRLGAVHARRPARRRRLPRRLLDRPRRPAAAARTIRPARRGLPDLRRPARALRPRTGRDLAGIDYYVAFQSWRLAVISEGVYARYLHGAMGDQGAMRWPARPSSIVLLGLRLAASMTTTKSDGLA